MSTHTHISSAVIQGATLTSAPSLDFFYIYYTVRNSPAFFCCFLRTLHLLRRMHHTAHSMSTHTHKQCSATVGYAHIHADFFCVWNYTAIVKGMIEDPVRDERELRYPNRAEQQNTSYRACYDLYGV